ncbi:hypothetical protein [Burkholderia gladioli]|uniref:hypothetical protein n=1 Tax=Burkholderia gladioli TaxID=28095 RepID=UPI0019171017|nr:hypothetical protein [Burkholderia gladioli]
MTPTRTTLLDLACRSALLRIRRRFDCGSATVLTSLIGPIGADMQDLAKAARRQGIDLRDSPLWQLLEYQDCYDEVFDRNRRVDVKHLTPMIIYECLSRGSRLGYAGWTITVGGSLEVTGDYGEPAWESRIWLKVPSSDTLEEYCGIDRDMARKLYRRITGVDFAGVDTLGIDHPHPAEGCSHAELIDYLEENGRLPLIASQESGQHWDAFVKLSVADPAACLALFDENGRYRDAETGFWASRKCERFDDETGNWYRWQR